MLNRLILTVCALFFLSVPVSAESLLGTDIATWEHDIKIIGGEYEFSDTFLSEIQKSVNDLEMKYSSEHFEKIGSSMETAKQKRRKNPLLSRKKVRSKFLLDLNLDKHDYDRLLKYIPYLGNYYSEKHIAQILPYIAFCLNYEVSLSEINFYVREMVKRETPPDIACERLYRVATDNI